FSCRLGHERFPSDSRLSSPLRCRIYPYWIKAARGIRRLRGRRGESGSFDQAAEVLDRSGADYTPSDPAVRGDHERAGEGVDGHEPVELSRDNVAGVIQAWVEKPVLLHVGLRAGRVVRHVDTDELDARWLELPRGNRQGRCFLLADR